MTRNGAFINGAKWAIHNLTDDEIKYLRENGDNNFNDVKEIIGTEMRVSPFGKIGTRTYKLGGIYMYINKALEFLKNELKVEYKNQNKKLIEYNGCKYEK